MILVVTCACGSSESMARGFLQKAGYQDWLSTNIYRGKDKSIKALGLVPRYPEVEMLENYLKNASKWVVILGWNENGCRWADIAHNATKSRIDAELIINTFA